MESLKKTILSTELPVGNSLLIGVYGSSNPNKCHIEIAETINQQEMTATSLFNVGDDRFSQGKARRAWLAGEKTQIATLLGLPVAKISALEEGQSIAIDSLNPTITVGNEKRILRVRINETVTPDKWQKAHLEQSAKRKGKDGDFITHKGQYIFSNCEVFLAKENAIVPHVMLEADAVTATVEESAKALGLTLA